jgi:hypothetical protein
VDSPQKSDGETRPRPAGTEHPEPADSGLLSEIPEDGGLTQTPAKPKKAAAKSRKSPERKNADALAQAEHEFYKIGSIDEGNLVQMSLDLQRSQLEVVALRTDIAERQKYGLRLFKLIVGWLALVLFTVWCAAAQIRAPQWEWLAYVPVVTEFKMSDAVLLTLIGSTTANVIGLLVFVVRYLFPNRDVPKQRS